METEIAVATVSGKAYFLIVNKLKERNIPFLSLIPGQTVPTDIQVVITTRKEKHMIQHENILVSDGEMELGSITNEIQRILQGKESYEKIVISIDPGESFGLVVIADGKINETANCFSVHEALSKVRNVIRDVDFSSTAVTIKIGNGVPIYKELAETFDLSLPAEVVLQVVSEVGTNRPLNNDKHRRDIKDIASATRIAGRAGHVYPRRKPYKAYD
jgi:hypothetical protein